MEVSSNEAPNDIENLPIPLDISIQQKLDGLSPLTEVSSNEAPNDIENPPIPLDISIQQELDGLSPLTPCCIYRVPERLRRAIPIAYTPQVVSIGPLHHGSKGLIGMEEHKMRYLKDFISRTKISLKDYLQMIRGREEKLRNCYAETIGLESDAFVKIILVDAAFIIEMLLKNHYYVLRDVNDRIFNKPWMRQDVWLDMLLLENQLPFFILEELYDKDGSQINNGIEKLSLVDLSHLFFERPMRLIHIEGTKEKLEKILSSSSEVEHFVDFNKKLYLTLDEPPPTGTTTTKTSARTRAANKPTTQAERILETLTAPSMTELHLAGVKFKVRSSENLFDIQFRDGILEIPKLNISLETELIITNLMAFEQCHCEDNYINDYVVVMDRLVNTSQDVELLVEHGIVENSLGENSAAATLINNLAYGAIVYPSNFQYATLFDGLNKHRKRPWNRWMATLSHKYFNTPWAGFSVAAAIVLIVLTILQTVFSGMSVI